MAQIKRRCRVLMLLSAAEQTGIAPLPSGRLHAFAYLADVMSPVWDLIPFDGKVYKTEGGPHYADLQEEIDRLAVLGLVQVRDPVFEQRPDGGARITGRYALDFSSTHLEPILRALGVHAAEDAIDPADFDLNAYLVELAGALGTLPDDEIESATDMDVTYRTGAEIHNVVDFAEWVADRKAANPSWRVAERFQKFLPAESKMLAGEKLYLYAAYLGRVMNGR